MRIDIVIVNWNSGQQLQECISSVRAHSAGSLGKCIVVDNGSHDGSADFLRNADDVDLVLAGANLGFGRACNIGAARGDSPFLLLLNPDACLLEGSLSIPLDFLNDSDNSDVGIVGVQLIDEAGQVQRTCARAPTQSRLHAKSFGIAKLVKSWGVTMLDWSHDETRKVDQVIGAFFFVRRALYKNLNGMDERFFVYFEEVDFSVRAARTGFKTIYLTQAQAFHKGGGVSEQVKAHRLFYSLQSRLQYAFKHFSNLSAFSVAITTLLVEPVSRLVLLLARGRWSEISDLGRGYAMLWKWILARADR